MRYLVILYTLFVSATAFGQLNPGRYVFAGSVLPQSKMNIMPHGLSIIFDFRENGQMLMETYFGGQQITTDSGTYRFTKGKEDLLLIDVTSSKTKAEYVITHLGKGRYRFTDDINDTMPVIFYYQRPDSITACYAYSIFDGQKTIMTPEGYIFRETNLADTLFLYTEQGIFWHKQYINGSKIPMLTLEDGKVYTNPEYFPDWPKSLCGEIKEETIIRIDIQDAAGYWEATGTCNGALLGALLNAGIY